MIYATYCCCVNPPKMAEDMRSHSQSVAISWKLQRKLTGLQLLRQAGGIVCSLCECGRVIRENGILIQQRWCKQ